MGDIGRKMKQLLGLSDGEVLPRGALLGQGQHVRNITLDSHLVPTLAVG